MPVERLADWWVDGYYASPAPYDGSAHNRFPLNGCGAYRLPCYKRQHPRRWKTPGEDGYPNNVNEGVRAIIGYSSNPAGRGWQPIYASDCDGQLPTGKLRGLVENLWRFYRARTHAVFHEWVDDPHARRWGVWYIGYAFAWLAIDAIFENWADTTKAPAKDDGSYFEHWAPWFEMCVVVKVIGDPDWEDDDGVKRFHRWIVSMPAGYGVRAEPKNATCNDVLSACAGVHKAIGDQMYPAEADQDLCDWDTVVQNPPADCDTSYLTATPCRLQGKYSHWYLPQLGSNHYKTPAVGNVIQQQPHYGLPVECTVVRDVTADGATTETLDDFWVRVAFTSTTPVIVDVDDAQDPAAEQNEIQKITIVDVNETGHAPDAGFIVVGLYDDEFSHSGVIYSDDDAAAIETAVKLITGVDDVTVTGTIADGEFTIEFTDPAGKNFILLTVYENTLDYFGDGFDVEVDTVQNGSDWGRM